MLSGTCRLHFYKFQANLSRHERVSALLSRNSAKLCAEPCVTAPVREASFARDLSIGKLNMSWIQPYPTLETHEELEDLEQLAEAVGKYFEESVDSKQLDLDGVMDPEVMQGLKDLGLFGMQIPEEYGGLGLNNIQYARLLEEVSRDGSITVMLAAHQAIGLKGILIAGNDEQKQKYLPKLATGELTAAFALTEPSSGSDAASIQTKARLSDDGKHWILNGEKIWITNGGFADVMTVFAKTPATGKDGQPTQKVSAFIVERAFGGVTSGKPEDKLGIRASNTVAVSFEDTPVPVENVLGEINQGFKIAMQILNGGRFSMGSSVAGQLKRLVTIITEHAHARKQFGKKLAEFELIQAKVFNMSMEAYAMESMAYMTAGKMDQLDDEGNPPDCSIEAAMVKIYSSESAWKNVSECLQILGGLGYMKDYPYERMLRDCRILLIFEGANEILRMFVALTSLQFAGKHLQARLRLLKKGSLRERITSLMDFMRDEIARPRYGPFSVFNPAFELKGEGWTDKNWLNPNLVNEAKKLEDITHLYRIRVYQMLKRYGKNIVNEQLELEVLSQVSIQIYAMSCVISRTNKSLFLALRNSDHDRMMCSAFVNKSYREAYLQLEQLTGEFRENNTKIQKRISEQIIENQAYTYAHPLDIPDDFNFADNHYLKALNKK